MNSYRVCWTIDLEADSPHEAAEKALDIQRNHLSSATVFEVFGPDAPLEGIEIDLDRDLKDSKFYENSLYRRHAGSG